MESYRNFGLAGNPDCVSDTHVTGILSRESSRIRDAFKNALADPFYLTARCKTNDYLASLSAVPSLDVLAQAQAP